MPARSRRSATLQGQPSVYGRKHQAERAALLPYAIGLTCPGGCNRTMTETMRLDLDHVPPLALHHHQPDTGCCYSRIVCARCNRAEGARLGNLLRRQRRAQVIRERRASRQW